MGKGVVTDEFGVEMAIEHNVGKLVEIKFPERSRRNGSVHIEVPSLQHPQLPSFDTRDRALVEDLELLSDRLKALRKTAVEKAVTEGADPVEASQGVELWVAFRAHVVRDEKLVANETPWKDIPSDAAHRHKRLMGIAEDRTDAAQAMLEQAEFECRSGKLNAQRANEPEPAPNLPPPPEERIKSGGGQADTWAFAAVVAFVEWAFETYQAAQVPFFGRQVRMLAERLLSIADDLQLHLTDGRPVNRNANSHTRIRGMLRTVMVRHPIPVGADDDDAVWLAWDADVRKTATSLLDVAKAIHRDAIRPPQSQTQEGEGQGEGS